MPALTPTAAFHAEHVRRYHVYGQAIGAATHAAASGHYAEGHKAAWCQALVQLAVYDRIAELREGPCAT